MNKKGFVLGVSLLGLSACNYELTSINQSSLCEVSGWQRDIVAAECTAGQKVVFLPSSFGNEQLPVIFAALNCDHRYSIALTNGGVSCIYTPLKESLELSGK
jgi:hypothetical protein